LADILPINPAQATALFSAATAAIAAALFYEIASRLFAFRLLATASALTLGLGARFWSQAIIPEVYTLNVLLVALTLLLLLRLLRAPQRIHIFLWLCFVGGLGLANHWPLYVANAPAFILLFFAGGWRGLKNKPFVWTAGAGALVLGLAPYLYLIVRPHIEPPPLSIFTGLEDWTHIVDYVARAAYKKEEVPNIEHCVDSTLWGGQLLIWEYASLGALAAVFGVWRFCRRRPVMWTVAMLWGLVATAPLLGVVLCGDSEGGVARTVFAAYPLPAMLFLMIFVAAGLSVLPKPLGSVVAFLLMAVVGVVNWSTNDRSSDTLAENYSIAIMKALPQNAAIYCGRDSGFPLIYRHYALGERPDIKFVRSENNLLALTGKRRLFYIAAPFDNYARHDWGIMGELLPTQADGKVEAYIAPALIDFYATLPTIYNDFDEDTRQWDKIFMRTALFDVSRMLATAAHRQTLALSAQAVREVVRQTPEGLFGELMARTLGWANPVKHVEIREYLTVLRNISDDFLPAWRGQLSHMEAILYIGAGQWQAAYQKLEESVDIDPSPGNLAAIDLLQLLARDKKWEQYRQLRQRFATFDNISLPPLDAACAVALKKLCR
jgi:hypothetical protein